MRLDGYQEAVIGPRALWRTHAEYDAGRLYATGGLYGRVIDLPADAATAEGVIVDDATAAELGRLRVMDVLSDGLRWARLTGGGCLVPIMDDGLINEPVNMNRIRRIDEFRAFSLDEIAPGPGRYTDPTQSNFGNPQTYEIRTARGTFTVHESRVIPIPGDPLPRQLQTSGIPWQGRPVARRAFAAVDHYYAALELSVSIMRRKQQAIYRMAGLSDALQQGMEAQVQKRISLVDESRGILNSVVVDSEDDYSIHDSGLGGIGEVCQEFQIALSADTGIPVTLLFGRSPAGQNATGEGDFRTFYTSIRGDQSSKLGDAMQRILGLIYAQAGMTAPDEWERIEWAPLEAVNELQAADVRLKRAQAQQVEVQSIDAAMLSGWLSEGEARAYAEGEGLYQVGAPDE